MHFEGRRHTVESCRESSVTFMSHVDVDQICTHACTNCIYIELIALVLSSIIMCAFRGGFQGSGAKHTSITMASFFLVRHPDTLFYSGYSYDDKVQAALIYCATMLGG